MTVETKVGEMAVKKAAKRAPYLVAKKVVDLVEKMAA